MKKFLTVFIAAIALFALVSCNGNSCSGIIETNVDNLDGDNKYDYYKSDQNIS